MKGNGWRKTLQTRKKRLVVTRFLVIFVAFLLVMSGTVEARVKRRCQKACTMTAIAAFKACHNEARNDYWIARGNCYNLSDQKACKECLKEAKEAFKEAKEMCKEQFEARLEICDELGEAPYDPEIDPANFVDPSEIGKTVNPNPYFPLIKGNRWEYYCESSGETIIDEVTEKTKEIMGVTCVIVHDLVTIDGEVVEDTEDWYAQDIYGNVWYFGEIAKEFEDGELVSIEGSWKAGEDDAKAGIIMLASPEIEDIYRQEFSLGNAEDMAKILSIGEESVTVPYGSFNTDVLKTMDFTPLEPDVLEYKYYAPGIGVVLEKNPDTGERVELMKFEPGSP